MICKADSLSLVHFFFHQGLCVYKWSRETTSVTKHCDINFNSQEIVKEAE